MSKRNLVIEEGSVEALAHLQKQDEEFCRRLRAAIETGRECCPTTVFTEPCRNRPGSNYMQPDLIRGYRACEVLGLQEAVMQISIPKCGAGHASARKNER